MTVIILDEDNPRKIKFVAIAVIADEHGVINEAENTRIAIFAKESKVPGEVMVFSLPKSFLEAAAADLEVEVAILELKAARCDATEYLRDTAIKALNSLHHEPATLVIRAGQALCERTPNDALPIAIGDLSKSTTGEITYLGKALSLPEIVSYSRKPTRGEPKGNEPLDPTPPPRIH
jgi:hypothetical protein